METNLSRYKKDLEYLLNLGRRMLIDLELHGRELEGQKNKKPKDKPGSVFFAEYQKWYSESHEVIRQLLPDRLDEFEKLYKGEGKRKQINSMTYTIQDWLTGVRASINRLSGEKYYNDLAITAMKFQIQYEILNSAKLRFESSLFEIKQLLQADLLDSELEASRELIKNGFLRGAGTIAGVVLEKHLEQVCLSHNVQIPKKFPSISDLNDLLKGAGTIDIPMWRFIQRLSDLRNLCGHNKKREPSKDELTELVDGVEKIIKTVF